MRESAQTMSLVVGIVTADTVYCNFMTKHLLVLMDKSYFLSIMFVSASMWSFYDDNWKAGIQ